MKLKNGFMKQIHLTIKNAVEAYSSTRYAHFILGFLVPLIQFRNSNRDINKIYIKTLYIMDKFIEELNFPEIEILSEKEHLKMFNEESNSILKKTIVGYDDISVYNKKIFLEVRDYLLHKFSDVYQEIKFPKNGKKILVVNRSPSNSFYSSEFNKHKLTSGVDCSGLALRSIPNFDDMVSAIKFKYDNVLVETSLDGTSLLYQIELFNSADILVAQHGAALVNCLWAKQDLKIVHIYPTSLDKYWEPDYTWHRKFFGVLFSDKFLNKKQVYVEQEDYHAEIDINLILSSIDSLLEYAHD